MKRWSGRNLPSANCRPKFVPHLTRAHSRRAANVGTPKLTANSILCHAYHEAFVLGGTSTASPALQGLLSHSGSVRLGFQKDSLRCSWREDCVTVQGCRRTQTIPHLIATVGHR